MTSLPETPLNDVDLLNALREICFTKQDLRAGWIGAGIPKTDNPEFQSLAKWAAEHWRMYETFVPEITHPAVKILDLGSGIGHSTINLATLWPQSTIVAIDNDEAAVAFAKKYNSQSNISYRSEDFFQFTSNEKFDYIFCLEVFEHLPPEMHELFMEKCLSLLTPTGKLFLTTPNALDELDAIYGHIGMLNRQRAQKFYLQYKKNIIEESFIDNRQLLTGQIEKIVIRSSFLSFEEESQNKSHFRIILSPTPETESLPTNWMQRYAIARKQWTRRHNRAVLIETTKKRTYQAVVLIPLPIRISLRKVLALIKRTQPLPQPESVTLPLAKTEPLANWHEHFIIHLASVMQPQVYVELGLYQCELFNRIVPYAEQLYGVDMEASAGRFMERTSGKSQFFHGTTNDFAKTLVGKGQFIDFLFIDANHSKESVMTDFNNYFPFVKDQGLILFHDAYPKTPEFAESGYCGDGYKAIEELSKKTDLYEMVTIPRHPGLAICRKRTKQLPWI